MRFVEVLRIDPPQLPARAPSAGSGRAAARGRSASSAGRRSRPGSSGSASSRRVHPCWSFVVALRADPLGQLAAAGRGRRAALKRAAEVPCRPPAELLAGAGVDVHAVEACRAAASRARRRRRLASGTWRVTTAGGVRAQLAEVVGGERRGGADDVAAEADLRRPLERGEMGGTRRPRGRRAGTAARSPSGSRRRRRRAPPGGRRPRGRSARCAGAGTGNPWSRWTSSHRSSAATLVAPYTLRGTGRTSSVIQAAGSPAAGVSARPNALVVLVNTNRGGRRRRPPPRAA